MRQYMPNASEPNVPLEHDAQAGTIRYRGERYLSASAKPTMPPIC